MDPFNLYSLIRKSADDMMKLESPEERSFWFCLSGFGHYQDDILHQIGYIVSVAHMAGNIDVSVENRYDPELNPDMNRVEVKLKRRKFDKEAIIEKLESAANIDRDEEYNKGYSDGMSRAMIIVRDNG